MKTTLFAVFWCPTGNGLLLGAGYGTCQQATKKARTVGICHRERFLFTFITHSPDSPILYLCAFAFFTKCLIPVPNQMEYLIGQSTLLPFPKFPRRPQPASLAGLFARGRSSCSGARMRSQLTRAFHHSCRPKLYLHARTIPLLSLRRLRRQPANDK